MINSNTSKLNTKSSQLNTPVVTDTKSNTGSNLAPHSLSVIYNRVVPNNLTINSVASGLIIVGVLLGVVCAVYPALNADPNKPTSLDIEGGVGVALGSSMVIASVTAAVQYMRGKKKEALKWVGGLLCLGTVGTTLAPKTRLRKETDLGKKVDPMMFPKEDFVTWRNSMLSYFREHSPECKGAPLQILNNYHCNPGFHSSISPVTGSRAYELELLFKNPSKAVNYLMDKVQDAIYYQSKHAQYKIIKKEYGEQALKISQEMYSRYLDKYRAEGVNEENAILWFPEGDIDGLGFSQVHGMQEKEKWTQSIRVNRGITPIPSDSRYILPEGVIAIHELMHTEERGPFDAWGREVLTTTKTMILLDEIYKKIHGIDITDEVNYNITIKLQNKNIPIGRFINFYRNLETKKNNLAEAYVSEESIEFLTKDCFVKIDDQSYPYWDYLKEYWDRIDKDS